MRQCDRGVWQRRWGEGPAKGRDRREVRGGGGEEKFGSLESGNGEKLEGKVKWREEKDGDGVEEGIGITSQEDRIRKGRNEQNEK